MRIRKPIFVGLGALVVAVAVTLTVVVVSGGSDEPARPVTEPPKGPALAPLKQSEEPLWTVENASASAAMPNGVLATVDFSTDQLTLSEFATGKPRWSLKSLPGGGRVDTSTNEAPLFVGHGASLAVLVPYRDLHNGAREAGLALLSGKDGSLRWKTPVVSGNDGLAHKLWTTNDHTALVNVFPLPTSTTQANRHRHRDRDKAMGEARPVALRDCRRYGRGRGVRTYHRGTGTVRKPAVGESGRR